MTEARWRRFPLTRISVLSDDKPRRLAGLTKLAASAMGFSCTLNEGIVPFSNSNILVLPALLNSSEPIISMGTGESSTERGAPREPTTAISSTSCS